MKYLLLILLSLASRQALAQSVPSTPSAPDRQSAPALPAPVTHTVEQTAKADIDEWQVLHDEATKNPFAHTNQFTVKFRDYTDWDWHYPLPGAKLISPYGGARHHAGTDLKTRANDTIYAAFPGSVTLSGVHYGYGNTVIIRHANGLETLYSHQSKNLVKKGDWVRAGQPIGLTGRTGRASTEHLHLEVRTGGGKPFDTSLIFDHKNHTIIRKTFVFTKQKNGTVKISSE